MDDEPIWRAVRDGFRAARDSWDNLNTPTKVIVAIVGCAALASNAGLVLQYGVPLIGFYVIYRVVRAVVLQQEAQRAARGTGGAQGTAPMHQPGRAPQQAAPPVAAMPPRTEPARPEPRQAEAQYTAYQPSPAAAAPRPAAPPEKMGDWREASRRHWKHHGRKRAPRQSQATAALVVKSGRERLADLIGSMILAAVIGAVLSLVVVLLRGDLIAKEEYAWLTAVSVLGSWAVLVPSKLWEGTHGDQALRRVTMLVLGMALGGLAFLAADWLMIKFSDSPSIHVDNDNFIGKFYDAKDGSPLIYAYLAYFGALFAVVRWWKQADPLRRTRLSVWSTGVCVFAAWLVDCLWHFPQPWGLMVAAIVSISVQLVSPHVSSHTRGERTSHGE